jgi:hypothetical protein
MCFVPQVQVVHAAQQLSHRSLRHLRWHLASLARTWTSATFWRYRRLVQRLDAEEDAATGSLRTSPRTYS